MNPQYPVFVPTKGRYKTPLTIKELERIRVPYTAVVEEQEYTQYKEVVKTGEIIVLPHRDKGLIATRNWIWDYVQNELKSPYYWTIDDNIRHFYELNRNMKWYVTSGTFFRVMEDFCSRYENVIIGGMQYEMFTPRKQKHPPFIPNTRIYSNMFIKTDAPYRNELFYNDDTDLCLRILKDGNCTVLFNMFVAEKIQTMRIKGGMTDYYEKTNKRREFAEMLQRAHPEVVKVVWKYNRWHHEVDYRPFRNNAFKLKEGVVIPDGPNEYGMKAIVTTPLQLKNTSAKSKKDERNTI
jgi:hypothetical protein